MKIKLYESKWDNKITGKLADDFYTAIKDGDEEKVKTASEELLSKCRDFFDEEDEYVINDIEGLISEFEDSDDEEDLNATLDELYDFCDGYSILIDVKEEPEDAEVFIDDTDEEDKDIEEIKVDPETDEVVEIGDEDIEECKK